MIIGVTHEKEGRVRLHRTVTCKVAIGLPPDANSNYPKKLDHFVFLKQQMQGRELKWTIDQEKQDHYGADCREFWIVLLDDDPEKCFRTEHAAYVKTRCWCRGDGERARRRVQIANEWPPRGEFQVFNGACANDGCQYAGADCKPSGDLYFMLQDFPELGTICRIHTSSWQSIRQIWSGLQDLAAVTGGRLMGVRCKLFVAPARNVFEQGGVEKTGTKQVLGIRLGARDVPQLMSAMAETAQQFRGLQKQLAGRVLDIEEDEDTRAPEIAGEFYHDNPAEEPEAEAADPELELRAEAERLMRERGFNDAQRTMRLEKHRGRMGELIAALKNGGNGDSSRPMQSPLPGGQVPPGGVPRREVPGPVPPVGREDEARRPAAGEAHPQGPPSSVPRQSPERGAGARQEPAPARRQEGRPTAADLEITERDVATATAPKNRNWLF